MSHSQSAAMEPRQDLNTLLAPHLQTLSSASTNLLTPLTTVLTTLIVEVAALRTAHDQLQARVSRIHSQQAPVFPHSIPSPPTTPLVDTPVVDPELTQPPSPLIPDTPDQNSPVVSVSPNSQNDSPQQQTDQNRTPPSHSPQQSQVHSERLKRRRRSSKRPLSGTPTPTVKQENLIQSNEALSSQEQQVCNVEKPASSDSSSVPAPSSSAGVKHTPNQYHTPKKLSESNRNPLKQCDHNLKVLPTTPTTVVKPKKRKSNSFSYEPVIEGYTNPADAAKDAAKIVARRETENCPPSFRPQRKSLSEWTCIQCQDAHRAKAAQASDPDVEFQRLLRSSCRHKEQVPRPSTPDGYWALDFAETPTQPP